MLAQNMAKLIITLPKVLFQEWGLDFIRLIKLASHYFGNWYILLATYYDIKWVKAKTLWTNTTVVTMKFLYDYILT